MFKLWERPSSSFVSDFRRRKWQKSESRGSRRCPKFIYVNLLEERSCETSDNWRLCALDKYAASVVRLRRCRGIRRPRIDTLPCFPFNCVPNTTSCTQILPVAKAYVIRMQFINWWRICTRLIQPVVVVVHGTWNEVHLTGLSIISGSRPECVDARGFRKWCMFFDLLGSIL